MKSLILCLFLSAPLLAIKADPDSTTFERRERNHRVDVYDFKGDYPHLEKIDIDGRRKKCVELHLTGTYPLLKRLSYEGGFGTLMGEITGDFPNLTHVEVLCGAADMDLDFTGTWHKSCTINIRGLTENIAIKLPDDVGLIIHTKTALKGKVISHKELKKKGFFKRTYTNEIAETAPITLTLNIEATEGVILLE
ncbi:MAG: hypothetical protein S4CHLAM45_00460 [Chlamydiales bacterium]|nr:hypothetical protein [Chlamydiales bacterium]MCH9619369.1 hypothetical protein [Chlamydiales bacterium]MCH9622173.1 hypothetical protein [Chlamydiales bacterium]